MTDASNGARIIVDDPMRWPNRHARRVAARARRLADNADFHMWTLYRGCNGLAYDRATFDKERRARRMALMDDSMKATEVQR